MARYQATMFLSWFGAVMVVTATDTTPVIPSLYPPGDLGALGGTGAEPEGVPGFTRSQLPTQPSPAEQQSTTSSSTSTEAMPSSTMAPAGFLASTTSTTSSLVETPAPTASSTSTTARTPAPPAPTTTATSTEPPAPEFRLGEVAIAISGLYFQQLTVPEQATLSKLYAEAIATTLNINPMWVRNMSEAAGRVTLGPGQAGNITNAGNFLTDVTARRLSWATQLNAFYQTPADMFEASKPKFNSAEFVQQLTDITNSGLGADTLRDRDDVLKLPLSVVTAVKDLPMMKAWTTSTATTTNTGSTTSSEIPPLPTSTTSSTVPTTTTTTAGSGSSFPWLWWLLGVLLCCLLAGGFFFAYRKFASPPKKADSKRSVAPKIPESPAAEDFVPLVQKPADPPKPPEPPRMSAPMAPTAPSYAPAPTVLTAPPVYMSAMPTTNVMPIPTAIQTAQPVRTVQRQAMPMQAVQAAPIATYAAAPIQAAPVATYTAAPAMNPSVAQAAALFDQLDVNHDGVITRAEMAAALRS